MFKKFKGAFLKLLLCGTLTFPFYKFITIIPIGQLVGHIRAESNIADEMIGITHAD